VSGIRVDTAQGRISRASGLLVELPFVELENRQEIGSGWRRSIRSQGGEQIKGWAEEEQEETVASR